MPSQSIEVAFPKWHAISNITDRLFWALPADWSDPQFITNVSEGLDDDLNHKGMTFDDKFGLCCAVIEDICNLQRSAEAADVLLAMDLVRLIVSTKAMQTCAFHFRMSLFYHWVFTSLSWQEFPRELNRRSDITRKDLLRVWLFFKSSNPAVWSKAYHAVLEWAGMIYYYVQRGGEHRALAEEAFDTLLELAKAALDVCPEYIAESAVGFLGYAGTWAESQRPKSLPLVLQLLENIFVNESMSREVRKAVGLILSTGFRHNLSQRKQWALKTTEEFNDLLNTTDRLSLLLATLDHDFESIIQDVMSVIESYVIELKSAYIEDQIDFRYVQLRYYKLLNPLLVRCADKGLSELILQIMTHWFGISRERRRKSPVLCCFPTHYKGQVYAFQGWVGAFPRADSWMISAVTHATNKWLDKRTIVVDDPHFLQEEISQTGEYSNEPNDKMVEDLLVEFYKLRELTPSIPKIRCATGLMISHYLQHPLQTLMLKEMGVTWPIITSYEEPLQDRTLRRAFLWTVGTKTGKREVETIAEDLRERGVEIDLHLEEDIDKETFRRIYECPEYDVIWIAAHGVFDPYKPHLAGIVLSADGQSKVLLKEILQMSLPLTGRRLFVMNMCSGGDALIGEGPTAVGIASMLAAREQATVSHLWSVYERTALVFGLLLVDGLLRTKGYFGAFSCAAQGLKDGLRSLQFRLRDMTTTCRRVAQDLDTTEDEQEWRRLYRWGSPVFYE